MPYIGEIDMNKLDREQWTAKTEKLNADRVLRVGDSVIDMYKNAGVVVKISPGVDIEDHGTIYVWQSEQVGYGDDNCEHYVEFGWQKLLRIVQDEQTN